ncbi:hypothetical protein TNCV_715951, partial [Trichonephila clavipes]
ISFCLVVAAYFHGIPKDFVTQVVRNSSPGQPSNVTWRRPNKQEGLTGKEQEHGEKNPFNILELHRSQMPTSKSRQGRLECPKDTGR